MWGQDADRLYQYDRIRIIPTRVGTRLCLGASLLSFQDHPHACGDKKKSSYCFATEAGSSPRVWGQGYSFLQRSKAQRIIPTRVGTSSKILFHEAFKTDHPHACGDKNIFDIKYYADRGSSPRVWGQGQKSTSSHQDHPHACGDKYPMKKFCAKSKGSSPRVWGQAINGVSSFIEKRIIPTRVGTSLSSLRYSL